MSGANGLLSVPGQSAFSIASFALEAFSDALRLEMKQFGVKVITIQPGNYAGATGVLNRSAVRPFVFSGLFYDSSRHFKKSKSES